MVNFDKWLRWDREIRNVLAGAEILAKAQPTVRIAVAVDDEPKRDYFVPRLQTAANEKPWATEITFKVIPMEGSSVEVRKKIPLPEWDGQGLGDLDGDLHG